MTKYISVVALIVIYQPSFQGVTTYPTLTSAGCVPSEPKILLISYIYIKVFVTHYLTKVTHKVLAEAASKGYLP